MRKYKELLIEMNACEEAIEFVGNKTVEQANEECPRGDWMLWIAKRLDVPLKELTLAKGHCANTVRHLMKDERSINGVDAAIAFGNGEITEHQLYAADAYTAAAAAAADAYTADAAAYAYAAAAAAAAAADAYAYTAAAAYAYAAAADAADAAAYAAAAYAAAADAAAYAAAAKKENQKTTADICRKYLSKLIEEKVNELLK